MTLVRENDARGGAAPVPTVGVADDTVARENPLVRWHMYLAMLALAVGSFFGPLQVLQYAGLDVYKPLSPVISSYYQGLTAHGVLNALVWTTFFIMGFAVFVVVRTLKMQLRHPAIAWAGFIVMTVGSVAAGWAILTNRASVLYTMYLPMQAHPAFYIGATLLVVGSWITSLELALTYAAWRRANPGVRTPLGAFGTLVNLALWFLATLGVSAEMLVMAIPWSLGLIPGVDVLLSRTLFWWFGHPLVYFWILPAYVVWYTMLPQQAGGKLFSHPLGRLAFVLLLVLSVPVRCHHQFTDPGIAQGFKVLHTLLTFGVAVPALLTAFNIAASLEIGGRAAGGKGIFGWIPKLPWRDASFTAVTLAMLSFTLGGIGGIMNASYNIDLIVHNTAWIPGHFHLTVASASTLTFMGVLYWLLPMLTGHALWSQRMARIQAWVWFLGVMVFGLMYHWAGLVGVPRRIFMPGATYNEASWQPPLFLGAIGGSILGIGAVLFLFNMLMTVVASRKPAQVEMPQAEAVSGPQKAPAWLDRWRLWLGGAAALIVIGYAPALIPMFATSQWQSPGYQVWGGPNAPAQGQTAAPQVVPTQAAAAAGGQPVAGDPAAGQAIFNGGAAGAAPCSGCHSVTPATKIVGPSLAGIAATAQQELANPDYKGQAKTVDEYLHESIVNPDVYVAKGYPPGVMVKSYGVLLNEQQIADLIAYLKTLK